MLKKSQEGTFLETKKCFLTEGTSSQTLARDTVPTVPGSLQVM